jgi:hypothetical protein
VARLTPSRFEKRSGGLWGPDSPLIRDARYALLLQLVAFLFGTAAVFVDPLAGAIVFGSLVLAATLWAIYSLYIRERYGDVYETIELEQEFDLYDATGAEAIRSLHRTVRFLQNDVLAIRDYTWGDGQLNVDYECSPGRAVDFRKRGPVTYVLIALDDVKQRGEIEDFRSRQKMVGSFLEDSEWASVMSPHPTDRAVLRVIFPKGRPPKRLSFTRRHGEKEISNALTREHIDGREHITATILRPPPHEEFTLHWDW